jgi:hypothetical protein
VGLASAYISQIRSLIHDLQAVDWTDSELLTIVNSARQRVALDAHCVRTFFQGLNVVPNVEQYPISGGCGGSTMTNLGSGYPLASVGPAPVVTISAPSGGGTTATAIAILGPVSGTVGSLQITGWGSGYTGSETITIAPPVAGVTATATPIILANILDILSIMPLWPGNTNARVMRWAPFTLFQAWARAYRGNTGYPQAWTNYDEGNLLFIQPIPDQPYITEIDAIIMPTDLATTATNDTQLILPFSDAVQWYGAYVAMIKLQNLDQADFFFKKYEMRVRAIRATRQDRRQPNIYQSSFRRMSRW